MNSLDTIQIKNQEISEVHQQSGLRRLITVMALALVWTFLSALIVGTYAAAIWTVIPTELLQWGAGKMNLIGYVSHCSFVPYSTLILILSGSIGLILALRLKRGRIIGEVVFVATAGGLTIGALRGIDIVMFMGMGAGIGIGIVLGIIIGMLQLDRSTGGDKK
ncbi:MAG: hypothetical protein ACFFCP_12375 [Promethearchaeota archaeon]